MHFHSFPFLSFPFLSFLFCWVESDAISLVCERKGWLVGDAKKNGFIVIAAEEGAILIVFVSAVRCMLCPFYQGILRSKPIGKKLNIDL